MELMHDVHGACLARIGHVKSSVVCPIFGEERAQTLSECSVPGSQGIASGI